MIAMAGMYLAGAPTFESFATGTIIVVAVAVLGSLTVLPALLSWLGDRVEKGGLPIIKNMPWNAGESGIWARVLNPVVGHPLISLIASAAVLIVLAVPAFSLHLAVPSPRSLPHNLWLIKTYDKIQATFPGDATPASVAIRAPDVTAPAVARQVAALRSRVAGVRSSDSQPFSRSTPHAPSQSSISRSWVTKSTRRPTGRWRSCGTTSCPRRCSAPRTPPPM